MSFISKNTIAEIAESVNVTKLSDAAAKALAPDVEYRLREVIQEALKFARNAKRLKLTTDDINLALRVKNIEPLYGFSGNRDPSKYVRAAGHPDVFFVQDKELDLEQFITADLPKPPLEVGVCPHWLVINGVQPSVRENMPVEKPAAKRPRLSQHKDVSDAGPKSKTAAASKDVNLPKAAPVVPPTGSSAAIAVAAGLQTGPPVEVVMPVKHVLSQELQMYYSKVAALLRGEEVSLGSYQAAPIAVAAAVVPPPTADAATTSAADAEKQKFVRQAILESLATDPGLPALIPYLVQLIVEEVGRQLSSVSRLKLLLAAAKSLLSNPYCEMGPYLHKLMPAMVTCVLAKRIGHKEPGSDHWSLRQEAAQLVAGVINKYAKDYPSLQSTFVRTLTKVMEDGNMPFTSHFGAIVGITSLGSKLVGVLLLPNLLKYQMRIGPGLADGKHPDRQYQAWRCYGALLDGACSYMHARIVATLSERLPYHLLAVLASSHPHKKGAPPDDMDEDDSNDASPAVKGAGSTLAEGNTVAEGSTAAEGAKNGVQEPGQTGGATEGQPQAGGATENGDGGQSSLGNGTQQHGSAAVVGNGVDGIAAANGGTPHGTAPVSHEELGTSAGGTGTAVPSLLGQYLSNGHLGFHVRLQPSSCPTLLGPNRPANLDVPRLTALISRVAKNISENTTLTLKSKYESLHKYMSVVCRPAVKGAPFPVELPAGIVTATAVERFAHEVGILFKVMVDSMPDAGMSAQVVRGTRGGHPSTWNVIVVDGGTWGVLDPHVPGIMQPLVTGPGAVYKTKRAGQQEYQPMSLAAILADSRRKPSSAGQSGEESDPNVAEPAGPAHAAPVTPPTAEDPSVPPSTTVQHPNPSVPPTQAATAPPNPAAPIQHNSSQPSATADPVEHPAAASHDQPAPMDVEQHAAVVAGGDTGGRDGVVGKEHATEASGGMGDQQTGGGTGGMVSSTDHTSNLTAVESVPHVADTEPGSGGVQQTTGGAVDGDVRTDNAGVVDGSNQGSNGAADGDGRKDDGVGVRGDGVKEAAVGAASGGGGDAMEVDDERPASAGPGGGSAAAGASSMGRATHDSSKGGVGDAGAGGSGTGGGGAGGSGAGGSGAGGSGAGGGGAGGSGATADGADAGGGAGAGAGADGAGAGAGVPQGVIIARNGPLSKRRVKAERSVKEVLADAYKEDADLDEQLGALSVMFGEAFVARLPLHTHLASMMW